MGRSSAFSYSASRYSYSYSYSKTPESIQVDHLFREAGTQVFGPLVNEILILLFEYEYRFTEYEYEYEKNHWYELPATIIPDRPDRVDAYRYNSASLRVRVIDKRFESIPREERDRIVESSIDQLPPKTQSDIITLVLLSPSEFEKPSETFREYMLNVEFENPSPTLL